MSRPTSSVVAIPGTDSHLDYVHAEDGRATRITGGGRTYFDERDGECWFDGGWVRTREVTFGATMLRHVVAGGEHWVERYANDARGRPVEVDGTHIERDARGRIVLCRNEAAVWKYAYRGEHLIQIDGPHGSRCFEPGVEGRPESVRESGSPLGLHYDAEGRRLHVDEVPGHWVRDVLGRLWLVRGEGGVVLHLFLWAGFRCLGRIDGPIGAPMAAVFSLDATGTPVRIIERDGVRRVPRDAFGEGLTNRSGVVGLHGGAVERNLVHYRARSLQPAFGAYDRPDPWHGRLGDPRRDGGYTGPLPVDLAAPYAVCRHDPIGRVDPTAEMSFWVGMSGATWSIQTTLTAFLMLDWWANLFGSLVGSLFDSGALSRFTSTDGLRAKHSGIPGVRRAGVLSAPGEVWTVSHIVWSTKEVFEDIALASCFVPTEQDPAAIATLSQYGTLWLLEPQKTHAGAPLDSGAAARSTPILLPAHSLMPTSNLSAWSRAGGRATPVFAGSRVPHFPAGAVHLDRNAVGELPQRVPAPQDALLRELEAASRPLQGQLAQHARLTVPGTSHGASAGDVLYVVPSNGAPLILDIADVWEAGGQTLARLTGSNVSSITSGDARVLGVEAKVAAPDLQRRTEARQLEAFGAPPAAQPYAAGDVLRLKWGSGNEEVVKVDHLEVELKLDLNLPAKLRNASTVVSYAPLGSERDALRLDSRQLTFRLTPGAPVNGLPARGEFLLVTRGSDELPARVVSTIEDHGVVLDRDLGGSSGDALKVTSLQAGNELGTSAKSPGNDTLTFVPHELAATPTAGFIAVHSGDERHSRRIVAKNYDVLVLEAPATAPDGTPLTVERHASRATGLAGTRKIEPIWRLTTSGGASLPADASALAVLAFSSLSPVPVQAGSSSVTITTTTPLVEVEGAPGAVVPPGQLAVLEDGAAGRALAIVRRIRLEIELDRELPAAAAGPGLELVLLDDAGPAYDATVVSNSPITVRVEPTVTVAGVAKRVEFPRINAGEFVLANGDLYQVGPDPDGNVFSLDGPAISATTTQVRRMDATSNGNGAPRAAIRGEIIGSRKQLRFDVWQAANAIQAGSNVAIVSGANAFGCRVASVVKMLVSLDTGDPVSPGAGTLHRPDPTFVRHSADITRDHNGDLVLGELVTKTLVAPTDVVVVPYVPTAAAASIAGQLSPGTVKVPKRLRDKFDLTRYEALVEHELHHTRQQAELGPLLLSLLPTWALELVRDLLDEEEHPKLEEWLGKARNVLDVWSVGGLLNLLVGSTYGGVLWLVALGYHWVKRIFTSSSDPIDPFDFEWFGATAPDAAAPTTIVLDTAGALSLSVGDRVIVRGRDEDEDRFSFFSNRRTVDAIVDGRIRLGGGDVPAQLFVARAGARTSPLETVDTRILNGLGMGWLTVFTDPYGELDLRVAPDPGSAAGILLRVGRHAFGTRAWGLAPFGLAFWDNLRRQWGDRVGFLGFLGDKPYLARMEKGASYTSGDTYYPLGLLRAEGPAASELGDKRLFVGDVLRYWYIETGGGRDTSTVVTRAQYAAPGVHLARTPVVMPYVSPVPSPPSALEPNRGAGIDTGATIPAAGTAVADAFVRKQASDPTLASARFFEPSARGWVPTAAAMERTSGIYASFTLPTTDASGAPIARHRVTFADGAASGAGEGREAMDVRGVDLIHDLEVRDVSVRLGGVLVAEGGELALLPFQRARLGVEPGTPRVYDVALMQPRAGALRRIAGDVSIQAQSPSPVSAEPMEVVRLYEHGSQGFSGETLAEHGMHLPETLHIPVRRCSVKVVTELPMLSARDLEVPPPANFLAGQTAHILVPVRLEPSTATRQNPQLSVQYAAPVPAGARPPNLAIAVQLPDAATPATVTDHLAFGGRLLELAFPEADPPEQEADVQVTITVGDGTNTADVLARCKLLPHFTLDHPAAGPFQAQTGGAPLVLRCSAGVVAGTATATPSAGVSVATSGSDVTLTVAAGTSPQTIALLVDDAADPSHKARRMISIIT